MEEESRGQEGTRSPQLKSPKNSQSLGKKKMGGSLIHCTRSDQWLCRAGLDNRWKGEENRERIQTSKFSTAKKREATSQGSRKGNLLKQTTHLSKTLGRKSSRNKGLKGNATRRRRSSSSDTRKNKV